MKLSDCKNQDEMNGFLRAAMPDSCDFGIEHVKYPFDVTADGIGGGEKRFQEFDDPTAEQLRQGFLRLIAAKRNCILAARSKCSGELVYAENWGFTINRGPAPHRVKISERGGVMLKAKALEKLAEYEEMQKELATK